MFLVAIQQSTIRTRVLKNYCRLHSFTRSNDTSDVLEAVTDVLKQQEHLLQNISDDQYTFFSPLFKSSCGGHIRHSLDHIAKPLLATKELDTGSNFVRNIHYDHRDRKTTIETNREAALNHVIALYSIIEQQELSNDMQRTVLTFFMLPKNSTEVMLPSTLIRELFFSIHHCIHHNAIIRYILEYHFPSVKVYSDFGMAPSTKHYLKDRTDE